jgi:diaminopimelate decarboxylase
MQLPVHVAHAHFAVRDDVLCIGSRKVTALLEETSGAPGYFYDRQVIDSRIRTLRNTLPDAVRLHYAVKANPLGELVTHVARSVDGLDVASIGELHLASASGISPARITFAGPAKDERELRAAIESGVVIVAESEGELRRIAIVGATVGVTANVCLRINPDFELRGSGIRMGGHSAPFGIDSERVPSALELGRSLRLNFLGFHIFAGSQCLRAAAICEFYDRSTRLIAALAKLAPAPTQLIILGAGFGIPYFEGESALDINQVGTHLTRVSAFVSRELPRAQLCLEIGRYIVGEAGVYVCRVVDRKQSRGTTYLVTNGGMHHHLAASGNLGQTIRRNYPIVVASKVFGEPKERVTIVGPLCTPLDVIGHDVTLPVAEPGDLIAVLQSGAYGFSSSPHRFLSHPAPDERLI